MLPLLPSSLLCLLAAVAAASAFDPQFSFNAVSVEIENRTLDEIHQAALKEGGVVTLWHGGDEKNQQDHLKQAFEARFPGMTLNLTVDLSKYHDVNIDRQLATGSVFVDVVALQTLNDFPRWKSQGVLLPYKPLGFDQIFEAIRDEDGFFNGFLVFNWATVFNTNFVNGSDLLEFTDFLKPEFKNKLVLTFPNDDDAVLYAFDLVLKKQGTAWLDQLLEQNPRFVRGTGTPATLIANSNGTFVASFTTAVGLTPAAPLNISFPTVSGNFVSWPQTMAILKDAPHLESAKLLRSFVLDPDYVKTTGTWPVRKDVAPPAGFPPIVEMHNTDVTKFSDFMADRGAVERLRFFFENRLGTATGLSPLDDDL
ncbi:hypothetical protein C8Q80DRAFT_1115295 [Daedaleopsis nitida]|nr:hypothetical protein C8Q80DRAFT_1115295 [Daedaleopsis nitida]